MMLTLEQQSAEEIEEMQQKLEEFERDIEAKCEAKVQVGADHVV